MKKKVLSVLLVAVCVLSMAACGSKKEDSSAGDSGKKEKLGMATMDKEQVTYVDLSEGDKIELTQQSPKKTLLDQIRLAIAKVKEYIPQE